MNTLEKLRFENASNELRNAVEEGEAIPFDDMANAKAYSDLCREWEEVRQLYRLFDWNYWQYKNGLCLGYDGSIAEKITASEFDAISIAVNGYVANLISAGRNLADYMDSVLKGETGKGSESYSRYKKETVRKYEKEQAYYFLYELRNYVQHGQTIVSTYSDGSKVYACFDLGQLSEPMHFSAKEKVKKSIVDWSCRIEDHGGQTKLSLGNYIEEYNCEIRDLYLSFMDAIKPRMVSVSRSFFKMVDNRPSLICKSPTGDAFVFYIEGDTVHIINGIQRRITGAAVSEMAKTVRADRKKAKEALREWRRFLARVRP